MSKKLRLAKKISNIFGIVFIVLGMVPVPVFSQVGSVYTADLTQDGLKTMELPAFSSYAGLLGTTSAKSEVAVQTFSLPDISGTRGDWLSLAINGLVLACDGDDCTPDIPADDGGETPADVPADEEIPPPAETQTEEPAVEPIEEPLVPPTDDVLPNEEDH